MHMLRVTIGLLAVSLAFMSAPATAEAEKDWVFAGTIEISSTQIAFIGSGSAGGGTLEFEGKEYPFSIGGLGIGGIGISKISAVGAVYNMDDVSKFAGTYVQARAGVTMGKGKGAMRLSNGNGVILDLKMSSKGLALSLGADGMVITMK